MSQHGQLFERNYSYLKDHLNGPGIAKGLRNDGLITENELEEVEMQRSKHGDGKATECLLQHLRMRNEVDLWRFFQLLRKLQPTLSENIQRRSAGRAQADEEELVGTEAQHLANERSLRETEEGAMTGEKPDRQRREDDVLSVDSACPVDGSEGKASPEESSNPDYSRHANTIELQQSLQSDISVTGSQLTSESLTVGPDSRQEPQAEHECKGDQFLQEPRLNIDKIPVSVEQENIEEFDKELDERQQVLHQPKSTEDQAFPPTVLAWPWVVGNKWPMLVDVLETKDVVEKCVTEGLLTKGGQDHIGIGQLEEEEIFASLKWNDRLLRVLSATGNTGYAKFLDILRSFGDKYEAALLELLQREKNILEKLERRKKRLQELKQAKALEADQVPSSGQRLSDIVDGVDTYATERDSQAKEEKKDENRWLTIIVPMLTDLVHNLNPDEMSLRLVSEGFLKQGEAQDIMTMPTTQTDRMNRLLNRIPEVDESYEAFKHILDEWKDQKHHRHNFIWNQMKQREEAIFGQVQISQGKSTLHRRKELKKRVATRLRMERRTLEASSIVFQSGVLHWALTKCIFNESEYDEMTLLYARGAMKEGNAKFFDVLSEKDKDKQNLVIDNIRKTQLSSKHAVQ